MHKSVYDFINDHTSGEMYTNRRVIEVGSLDVNGSVRKQIETFRPKVYLGVDFVPGKGVDVVEKAEDLSLKYGKNSFDTVVSTEMLEHAENWRECINNMKEICKEWLIITTRGPGFPFHAFPHDYWRYTRKDFEQIFADFDIKVLLDDTQDPGVFMVAKKTRRKRVDLSGITLTPAPIK